MNNFIVTKIIDRYYYLFRINRYVFFIDLLKAFLSVAMDRYNLHPKKQVYEGLRFAYLFF